MFKCHGFCREAKTHATIRIAAPLGVIHPNCEINTLNCLMIVSNDTIMET
jgi:hypothetical protein